MFGRLPYGYLGKFKLPATGKEINTKEKTPAPLKKSTMSNRRARETAGTPPAIPAQRRRRDRNADLYEFDTADEQPQHGEQRVEGNDGGGDARAEQDDADGEQLGQEEQMEHEGSGEEEMEEQPDREVVDLLDIEVPPLPPPVQNVDGSGARLMIDRIEVENFKSYYGKHTIGPFHKNFSSIVGPNGSGKSNVIDSLLFVFGYKASRTRGKKATDMLHKSANHKELAHCSVEVHFHKVVDKGTDECEIVPHSQFSVKRLLTRDNKSTYYWSKKMEKTNVVTDKLRKLGIDLDHNRFLILQGEVEKIALMKPRGEPGKPDDEGMLEYLEDIIGSSRLKAPIEKLTEKVDELQQLRTDRLNRMKTAEKAKAEWEGPKDALVDFLVKSNEVVWNKNKLYHIEKFSARGNLNEAMTQKASKVEEQEQTEAAIACIEADLKRRQDQIKKTKKELESIEKKYAAVQERKKELDDAGDANKQSRSERILQKQELRKEKDKCEKELDTARKSGDTLPAKIEQLRKEVEECEDREKNVEASVAAGRHKVDSETKPIQEKLVDLEKQLAERAQVEDKCKASRDEAQNELDRLKLDENREQKKLREVGLKIEEAEQKLQKHETDRENARTYLERLKSEQETAQEELKTLEAQEPQLAKTYSNRLQNKTDCEERLQQQKAAKGGKGALNTLLRAQKDGKIKGIIGRLGDLGSIDEKVDGQVVDPSGTMTGGGNSEQRGRITINDSRGGAAAAQRRRSDQIATEENLQILNAAVEQSKAQLNELRQKIGSLREKMTKNESAIRQLHNNLSASEKGAKMAAEMIETHKKSLGAQEKRAADAKADPERVQQIEETIKEREKEMLAARERAEKIGKTVDLEKAKIDEITHRLLGKEMDKLKAIQTEKKDANDRIVKSNATLDRFKRKESSSSKRIEEINAELEENQREIEKLKEAYEELKVQVSAVFKEEIERNDEILQKRNELEQLTNQSDGDLGSELVEKKKQLNVIKQKVQSLVELVHDAKRKFDEKKASLSHLKLEDLNKLLDGIGGLAFRGGAKQKQAQRPTTSGTDPDASTEEDEENEGGAENNEQGPVKNEPTVPTGNLELDPEFEFDPTAAKLPKYDDRVIERWIGRGTLEDAISCVATMLHALETQVKSAKVDKRAIEEFKKREQKYLECYELLEEATKRREDHRRKLDELRKRRLSEFFAGFEAISLKLKEMYQTITIGGDAELVLKDKCDPFSEGVEFGVRPPKKSWKEIANLSGGEKTLASLALVFALHHYKPTPLYVMDEIDAALDFKNVSIIAHYVKERTKNAQFIIISLRNHMFELADRLVGIYKTHDCTKHVVIDPKRIALGTPAAQMSETSVRPLAQRNVSDTSNDAVVPTQ